jgi:hypothetical protein
MIEDEDENLIEPEACIPLASSYVAEKKQPLTIEQQQAIWATDEFHGKSGSYISDPYTGKRTLKQED